MSYKYQTSCARQGYLIWKTLAHLGYTKKG